MSSLELDFDQLVSECITCLKGERSFEQLARKLDVNKSTVYSWVHQKSRPHWDDFWQLLVINHQVPDESFGRGINLSSGVEFLQYFIEKYSLKEVIQASGLSRNGPLKITTQGDFSCAFEHEIAAIKKNVNTMGLINIS